MLIDSNLITQIQTKTFSIYFFLLVLWCHRLCHNTKENKKSSWQIIVIFVKLIIHFSNDSFQMLSALSEISNFPNQCHDKEHMPWINHLKNTKTIIKIYHFFLKDDLCNREFSFIIFLKQNKKFNSVLKFETKIFRFYILYSGVFCCCCCYNEKSLPTWKKNFSIWKLCIKWE
jgi:hypothetical protein